MKVTKSDFITYLEAPMHLWAAKHTRHTAQEASAYEQHLFEQGYIVEDFAEVRMQMLLNERYNGAQLLLQPAFRDGPFEAIADAVIYDAEHDVYDIYEIKSASSVQTSHKYDITFQTILCEEEIPVRDAYVVHLNKDYTHHDEIDVESLFVIQPMNDVVQELRAEVLDKREKALHTVLQSTPDGLVRCVKAKTCPCPDLCHPNLPDDHIFLLPRLSAKKAHQLRDQGILSIHDLPPDFPLSDNQRAHASVIQNGRPHIDREAIRDALDGLAYPLLFLDYETYGPALPMYPGYQAYQHMVFQYSLHIIEAPGGDLEHVEFVVSEPGDPGRMLADHLSENLPDGGTVIVWNESFEGGRNREMGALYPEHAAFFADVNRRMFDLMVPFKDGQYVHPDFRGSYSIKAVLPVLVPELSYDDLTIPKGDEAMVAWWEMISEPLDDAERAQIRADLLAYCERDTLAMVEIWRHLMQL